MSQELGPQLPGDLYRILADEPPETQRGRAITLLTVDPAGYAHPALLSYREVGARDAQTLRLVVYAGSNTTGNLRANGHATLAFVDERFVYYVKGTATEIPAHRAGADAHFATFDIGVQSVLADAPRADEAGAHLVSGITFRGLN
ncbi:MAG: pyridoxamine 5'-phosphate oxidase family protein [Chloroflexota bacterium]